MNLILSLIKGDPQADRAVPPSGFTARITVFTAGAMAFLAVFALALSLAAGRIANNWSAELAQTSTLRISASAGQAAAQTTAAIAVLETTPGIASARPLNAQERQALLEPWFGPDLPLDSLPIPELIEIVEESGGYDATGLRARLQAEVPGAVLDDHTRWRAPLIDAAQRLRSLGWFAIALIAASLVAVVTLAAQAALAANGQVIQVMRLVGATDTYIARAFVRRFTLRGFGGAVAGTLIGMIAIALLPNQDVAGGLLTSIGFQGIGWLAPLLIPLLAGCAAFFATRTAALRILKEHA